MTNTTSTPADRVAPNSAEAEEAVLGSVLINPEAYDDVSFLVASDFFIVRNGWVWQAIVSLVDQNVAIDNLTVIQKLEDLGQLDSIGGSAYITRLINNTPTHVHAETYAQIIVKAAQRRAILAVAGEMATQAIDSQAETSTVIEKAQEALDNISVRHTADKLVSGYQVVSSALDDFLAWTGDPKPVRGLHSGIPYLDNMIGGFIPGSRPYTWYGATGMGKTRLIAHIATNLMEQEQGIIISTETDPVRWVHRVVSNLTGVSLKKLRSGDLTPQEKKLAASIYARFDRLAGRYHMLGISGPTPTEVKSNVRKLMRQYGCSWVVCDSINNIIVPGVTDIYPRTNIAMACTTSLGLDFGLVVLQTAQVGRNMKNRVGSLMPRLEDAKGSGDIEQGSGVVFGVYRHDYYVKRQMAKQGDTFPVNNTTLVVLKDDQSDSSGLWIPLREEDGQYIYDDRMKQPGSIEEEHVEPEDERDYLEGF